MLIAHAGIAFFVVGVTCVGVYEKEKDVRLVIGEGRDFGGYVWTLEEIRDEKGQNYNAVAGILLVEKDGNIITRLKPEKRAYFARPENAMSEAGIHPGWHGDLYASLGEKLLDGAWSARLQVKPFIRFIWGGALLMAIGGLVAVIGRRRQRKGGRA